MYLDKNFVMNFTKASNNFVEYISKLLYVV